jgi:FkbM family methyltransferase
MDMHPSIVKWFWRLNVQGTIHAGAHRGEENDAYVSLGFGPVTWIEAIPGLANYLKGVVPVEDLVVNATLWSVSDHKMTFNVTNSTGSSSLFELAEHKYEYPGIFIEEQIEVSTITLDDLNLVATSNLLVLDLQGAEYEALQGASKTLQSIDYLVTEVNRRELYSGIKLVSEIDELLNSEGFYRVATRWTRHGWGEALYIKSRTLKSSHELTMRAKIAIYWVWLHFFEIPIVAMRSGARAMIEWRSASSSRN